MCLKLIGDVNILVAEEDIICYKDLNFMKSGVFSHTMDYQYIKGKINPLVHLSIIDEGLNKKRVNHGYHSRIFMHVNNAIMIIPKGTKYIIGGENSYYNIDNYVSETIIFYGKNNWFNRFKLKYFRKCTMK